MPKGHPGPFRLLSAGFGKAGASAIVARSLSPRSAKGGTAAIPLYGSLSAFLGLGSDTRGLMRSERPLRTVLRTVLRVDHYSGELSPTGALVPIRRLRAVFKTLFDLESYILGKLERNE